MRLNGKVAIVTGGGRNIGREISLAFAREGAHVVCCGRTPAAVESTSAGCSDCGPRSLACQCDVSDENAVAAMVRRSVAEFGRVDILVNNAGITGPTAPVTEVDRADWDATLAVNLTGAYLCAKHVLPVMKKTGDGRILNIASVAGQKAYPLRSPYAVSKWGMIGLSRTLAAEWGGSNIKVNTIVPGPIEGERIRNVIRQRADSMGTSEEAMRAEYTAQTALRRFAGEQDVARVALFLASAEGDNITGQVFNVCAGFSL